MGWQLCCVYEQEKAALAVRTGLLTFFVAAPQTSRAVH